MKILVIGSGGREHALCWRFVKDSHHVFAMPGSHGIATLATCLSGDIHSPEEVLKAALDNQVALVVIGPEVPLVQGLADKLRLEGVVVFGPGAQGARLEGSKEFSKAFFKRHHIPSAKFFVCKDMPSVENALAILGGEVVVKVDGLAAGKGVVVCDGVSEARAAARLMFEGRFGQAGAVLIVEEKILGRELSVMAICDGNRYELMAEAEDHKAIFDGDKGPNTGGMGTVSPVSRIDESLRNIIKATIFDPTLEGLKKEGIDFRGVLYAGLMIDADSKPWLLEYNVRFGDPETQPVMMRMQSDLGAWLFGAAQGKLPNGDIQWDPRTALCVILASAGYPESSSKGDEIVGLASVESSEVQVFHAGTKRIGNQVVTDGGRVFGVTALGKDVAEARKNAYAVAESIQFSGMQFRRDIGMRNV